MPRSRRITSTVSRIALAGATLVLPACDDRTFFPEGVRLAAEAEQQLIAGGACATANDCIQRSALLWTARLRGLDVELYGVTDAQVIAAVVAVYTRAAVRSEGRMSVDMRVFTESKADNLRRVFGSRNAKYHITVED